MDLNREPFLLFEDTIKGDSFYFTEPIEEICARDASEVIPAFARMDELGRKGFYVAGFVSYEAGYCFFPSGGMIAKAPEHPLLHFYAFTKKITGLPENLLTAEAGVPLFLSNFCWDTSREHYVSSQNQIHEHLCNGDIYQQNQTLQMTFACNREPLQVYRHLRKMQKTSYTAYLNFPDYKILSFSPELFYQKTKQTVVVEPMKGTLVVSEKPEVLKNDEKNISENLMIVDLLRNDLGRIAHPGSVKVEQLFHVQTFETVHQMTSKISAQVDKDISVLSLFESLFPCGSITGAPKWSAMKFIHQQEVSARGVYTGAIGYIEPNNDQSFNVAIRTLTFRNNLFNMGVGGGIVADSDIKAEYQEALLKSRFVRKLNSDFFIFETFLFDGFTCRYLSLHLQRLLNSAQEFGFEIDLALIESEILFHVRNLSGDHKIKVKLMYDGEFAVESQKIEKAQNSQKASLVALSAKRVDSQNIFQKHKTSRRELYDADYEVAQKNGFYDFIFLNEKNQVVEASRHNIFIKTQGQWRTPPLSSGALPGIARQRALGELRAQEEMFSIEDVRRAEEILLTNSVRGCVRVQWREL
jgi:para-aminobenzoate synthetase / 4-amino-4-deoxychorismate lyase